MTEYRGRFAPSPTGLLHHGSLFAAVVSYCDAKANQGQWRVRIEDIDPPREREGATAAILSMLEAHSLYWDGPVTFQSAASERYEAALEVLDHQQRLFWCNCTRKQLREHATYPGTCRHKRQFAENHAIRFISECELDSFDDLFQGHQKANVKNELGDVMLRRRDGLFAYQLAVVCDDIAEGITHVVRGLDLLESTYWQRELYRAFNKTAPQFGHFAIVTPPNADHKLSKQSFAPAIRAVEAPLNLNHIFKQIGMNITLDTPSTMLHQAINQWQRSALYNVRQLDAPE